ncbi:Isoniazid-inducible protein iniC [Gordonia desulfuricans]|uniref:Isoniazid-inducible protein iniC n=1 Tax=Gordonia desulfuricans TaxID=89051 RepID=A0A7K3LKG3_9ACTN|nr:dynamin family protein [Gordonia desulfuricans]NDK88710.1 Isoniazid-inducible protein iniC [Gordonia desulfuricans]
MSTSDRVRSMTAAATQAYRETSRAPEDALDDLDRCSRRLGEPLRIALAGALKAGKSTLLNALIGEELAPTDATECTRIVTWFHHGPTPTVRAHHMNGLSAPVPIARVDGHLDFDLDTLDPTAIDRLEVSWPTTELTRRTIIDTPGTASLNSDVSARTMRLLAPEDGVSGADAVVYLMRSTTASDVSTLSELSRQVGGSGAPLGVIGVISRADEIGVGRIDAMLSAKEVAARSAADLSASGLCQAVVPVAGLLALTARTMRQREFRALSALASAPAEDLQLAMLSADRFTREESTLPLEAETRTHLIRRFGLFGIRIGVALVQGGVADANSLAEELLARSGLVELQQIVDVQFGQRAEQLKVHSALVELTRILARYPTPATRPLADEVRRMLGDVHGFEEVRLLGMLRSRRTTLSDGEIVDATRLIGGYGTSADDRLGLDPFETMTSGRPAAIAAVQRWRGRAGHPLNDSFTTRVCRAAARSAEGIVATMDAAAHRAHTAPGGELRAR